MINKENPFFSTGNQQEYDNFIKNVVNKLFQYKVPVESLNEIKNQEIMNVSEVDDLLDTILSTGERGINLTKFAEKDDDVSIARFIAKINKSIVKDNDGVSRILFLYKDANDNIIPYVVKGRYKHGYLYNAELETIINDTDSAKEFITNELSTYYNDTFIEEGVVSYDDLSVRRVRVVNREHQIFKQLRNAFKQELLDGVAAARLMFKTDVLRDEQGNPILVNGKQVYRISRDSNLVPILKEEWAADLNGLSPIYYFNKGKAYAGGKLTGRVFESDRFIIFDENSNVVKNYGNQLLNSVVQYLGTTKNSSIDNLLVWSEEDGTFNIELNASQEAAIDAKIEQYINDFVDTSYNRIQESKDFMKGRRVTIDNVADYMLNHQLMYIASNELLEGDTKYYKDVQTFLKRTKEYQASGNPYGIASIRRTLTSSPLEKIQIGPANWNITLSDRFNAITFHTTKKFKKSVLDSLEKVLSNKKIMGNHAMSKEDAHILMYGIDGEGGYTDAKVNDAQSYITFEEWVRRVAARGELDKYKRKMI